MSFHLSYGQLCTAELALARMLAHYHLCGESLLWRAWRLENLKHLLDQRQHEPLEHADRLGLAIAIDQAALLLALTKPKSALEYRLKQGLLTNLMPACPEHAWLQAMIEVGLALDVVPDADNDTSSTLENLN